MNNPEKEKLILELSDYVYNRFRKEGKLKRILEYNHILEENDIYNSIVVSILEFLRTFDHNLLPTNGKNRHTLFCSAYRHSLKVFTEYIQEGSNQIYRMIKTKNGHKIMSDRKFQVLKRKYSRLDSVSKRNTCSIDSFNFDGEDKRNFFEKNYTKLLNDTCNSPFYIPPHDEEINSIPGEEPLKIFGLLKKLKVTTENKLTERKK